MNGAVRACVGAFVRGQFSDHKSCNIMISGKSVTSHPPQNSQLPVCFVTSHHKIFQLSYYAM